MAGLQRKGKKSNIFITIVIAIAVVAICIFFKLKVREIRAQNINDNKKIEELNKEIDKETERTENLETYSKYVNTKQFVELMARNKLGLVYPNEVIFKNEE